MAIENENEIADWMKTYESLPEERRDLVQRWFAMQKLIIENTGISPEVWFRHVQWAMDNPFDYRFIAEHPDQEGGDLAPDSARVSDERRNARALIGATSTDNAPVGADGPGLKGKGTSERTLDKELFSRFMNDRMNKGRK